MLLVKVPASRVADTAAAVLTIALLLPVCTYGDSHANKLLVATNKNQKNAEGRWLRPNGGGEGGGEEQQLSTRFVPPHKTAVSDVAEENNHVEEPEFLCYDPHLASYIEAALRTHYTDMGKLVKFIFDQMHYSRFPGNSVVHAFKVHSIEPGTDWDADSNGDVFSSAAHSPYGCYYRDPYTFVSIVRYR